MNNSIFSLDLGGSTLDMVEFSPTEKKILQKKSLESHLHAKKNIETICEEFGITQQVIANKSLSLTGASALHFPDEIKIFYNNTEEKIILKKIFEFESIAKGGKFLSKKNSGLVVSLGTGTAMVAFEGDRWEHVKGTGIGGGTFMALGDALLQTKNFSELQALVEHGNLHNIDISVGDIAGGNLGTLPAKMTAANFAKYSPNTSQADIALGIANLVGQSIASLAVEKAQRLGLKTIIIGGKFSRLSFIVERIIQTGKFFDIEIIVPKNAGFMTSIGAAVE